MCDKNYELNNGVNVMAPDSSDAKPASSCHVWWGPREELQTTNDWTITNSVTVDESFHCTYFCLIGFNGGNSGGYGGIQEDKTGRKLAIFSLWNSPTHKTKALEGGADCIVRPFGGEGEGMQCLRYIDWQIGETITQEISGCRQVENDGSNTWVISSWLQTPRERIFLASYEWKGNESPFMSNKFYSFVEDWDRCPGSIGFNHCRKASFLNPTLGTKELTTNCQMQNFTHVKDGADKFGVERIRQSCSGDKCSVVIKTGGIDQ